MEICRQVGQQLADPNTYSMVPTGALGDQAAKIKLIQAIENQVTADINAVLGMLISRVVACVCTDHSLNNAADNCLPGLPANVSTGLARVARAFESRTVLDERHRVILLGSAEQDASRDTLARRRDGLALGRGQLGGHGEKLPQAPRLQTALDAPSLLGRIE
jgi:hypothetical protein